MRASLEREARVFTSAEGKVAAQLDPVAQYPLLRVVEEKQIGHESS